jgi:hypothetical protein
MKCNKFLITLYVMAPTSKKTAGRGLGDAIREEVARRDTTLERASTDLGLVGNALSRWNTGIEPGAEFYGVLMDFLGVSLAELGALIVVDQLKRAGLPLP